jgi:peptide/nickel transport system permease protein
MQLLEGEVSMATEAAARNEVTLFKPERVTPGSRVWRRFRRHRLALIGGSILILLVLMAIFAPLISPYDPYKASFREPLLEPSPAHWLGTDDLGRDLLSRLIYGSRVSLSVGLVAVSIYMLIGTVLGLVSGYLGGVVDQMVMRVTDAVMSFPSLLIIIVAVSIAGPNIYNVMLAIGLLQWPRIARLARGQVLYLREMDFITAAACLGVPTGRMLFIHLLPNLTAELTVAATFGVADAIIIEAGLSFLGLGVQPPLSSWGNLLTAAQSYRFLTQAPWMWIPPGLLISLATISINLVGDALRDALDPRTVLREGQQ